MENTNPHQGRQEQKLVKQDTENNNTEYAFPLQ